MKFLRYITLVLFLCPGLTSLCQITFVADTLTGCDSLEVTFTYINADLVDTVSTVDWDFGNGTLAAGKDKQTVSYDNPGVYSVSININGNTIINRPDYIHIYPSPRAGFWWSDSLELGSYTVIMVNPPQTLDTLEYSYRWFVEGVNAGTQRGILHTFPQAGDYMAGLIVTNEHGCADTSVRMIRVSDVLDCPNVFTPNEDGYNDFFIVSSNGVTVYSLSVYSSSGILVYKAKAPLIIWDGRNLSGQELTEGTYFYIIRPDSGSGTFEKKGFVELYR